jgi:hypothetical protein
VERGGPLVDMPTNWTKPFEFGLGSAKASG